MAVLLKNLRARALRAQDLAALNKLVHECMAGTEGLPGGPLEGLLTGWTRPESLLAHDAWVIVTTGGQLVGFACVWQEAEARVTIFLCVDPEYRERGIGTLLLRMAEVRAREYTRQTARGERVVMQGFVSSANAEARHLFAREGYQEGRPFLRVVCVLSEEDESRERAAAPRKLTLDVGLGELDQPAALAGQDMLCTATLYRTYEKELYPASCSTPDASSSLETVGV